LWTWVSFRRSTGCYNSALEVPLKSKENLIWIDLEMTGLDPDKDLILEIATVVTDKHLVVLAEGPMLAIHQSDEVLNSMDGWNTRQHQSSGLWERVKESSVTEQEAEEQTLTFLRAYVDPITSPMCGNSICQDRRFLVRHMPELAAFFHYRHLDVSSLKILAHLWAPGIGANFEKTSTHLALADIHDSIRELRFYREHLLRLPS
jgi:oligoribonuclease